MSFSTFQHFQQKKKVPKKKTTTTTTCKHFLGLDIAVARSDQPGRLSFLSAAGDIPAVAEAGADFQKKLVGISGFVPFPVISSRDHPSGGECSGNADLHTLSNEGIGMVTVISGEVAPNIQDHGPGITGEVQDGMMAVGEIMAGFHLR